MNYKTHAKAWGIGLTGGIATGKSLSAQIIQKQGYFVLDADNFSRKILLPGEPAYIEVLNAFGNDILNDDKSINRGKLREIIFSNASKKQILEQITHPQIAKSLKLELEKNRILEQKKHWFYEAALLFEVGRNKEFNQIWVTYCPQTLQIDRLKSRDNINTSQAMAIIDSQWPAEKKKALADVVIETDVTKAELEANISQLLGSLAAAKTST